MHRIVSTNLNIIASLSATSDDSSIFLQIFTLNGKILILVSCSIVSMKMKHAFIFQALCLEEKLD